jgi:F-type H+-transporting ATPase subunit b
MNPAGFKTKRLSFLKRFLMIGLVVFLVSCSGLVFASSEGGGHEASKGWVATDTYRVMNFAVLAIAIFFLARKPASHMLSSRIKGIKEELTALEGKKRDAEKTLAEFNEKLTLLEKEGEAIVAQYIEQGRKSKEKILEEAAASAEKMKEQARRNIEHEYQDARKKLQQDIVEKALLKAEELVKNTISPEDQGRLVDEYLEKVRA